MESVRVGTTNIVRYTLPYDAPVLRRKKKRRKKDYGCFVLYCGLCKIFILFHIGLLTYYVLMKGHTLAFATRSNSKKLGTRSFLIFVFRFFYEEVFL